MLKFLKYFSLIFFLITGNIVSSAENNEKLLTTDWTFKGPFGKFDRASLQRGYQVYQEVCASCHSLKYMSYRNLSEEGGPEFSVREAKAIASNFEILDGPNPEGEMFTRLQDYLINLQCLTQMRKKLNQQTVALILQTCPY